MTTFRHNKKRNTGLVYEFLVRRLGQAMVDQDKPAYQKTLEILRRYYAEGTVLAEEREIFEVVRNTRGVTEETARRILSEVQRAARKMDARKIDIKKSNLIKEINYAFGQGFFGEHRIPDYRLLASIQMVVDSCRSGGALTESVAEIRLEEGLVQYMTTRGSYAARAASKDEVDSLVMRLVAKRFEEKYSKSLVAPQKALLERYIRYQVTGDEKPLRALIESETKRVSESMERAATMKEVLEDRTMADRLQEARSNFVRKDDLGQTVEDLMLYQRLAEELDSNE